jgi:predicted amino acid racemase
MLYLTEVSHRHGDRSYCFGGGLYVDPVFPPYQVRALVGADADEALGSVLDAFLPDPQAIDYYGQLEGPARVGDSVVFGFRAQAFVTRALVVALCGVSSGAAEVAGISTAAGYSAEGAG